MIKIHQYRLYAQTVKKFISKQIYCAEHECVIPITNILHPLEADFANTLTDKKRPPPPRLLPLHNES